MGAKKTLFRHALRVALRCVERREIVVAGTSSDSLALAVTMRCEMRGVATDSKRN